MPSSPSKISFDAINIVRAENIYLTESKRDRSNNKRKTTNTDEKMHEKKKPVPDMEHKNYNTKNFSRNKNIKLTSSDIKLKNGSLLKTASKKSRKRQVEIGKAYSKLESQTKNNLKSDEGHPKPILTENCSRTSLYLTPRLDFSMKNIDLENMNPDPFPLSSYESELDEFIRSQYPDFEDFSEYNLEDPLILEDFDEPKDVYEPGFGNLRHFKELIDAEESSHRKRLDKKEIQMLKEIVQADERFQKLKRDDYEVLKDILMSQLREISEQEQVIKIALQKIRQQRPTKSVKIDTFKVETAEQPLENHYHSSKVKKVYEPLSSGPSQVSTGRKTFSAGQEVSVFFKNVPTLEREIKILKMLGCKLEQTLKKSTEQSQSASPSTPAAIPTPILPQPTLALPTVEPPTSAPHTSEPPTSEPPTSEPPTSEPPTSESPTSEPPPKPESSKLVTLTIEYVYFKHNIGKAMVETFSFGCRCILGEANEFKISHQTIDELKLEREFYIVSDVDNFTLERTSFDLLRHNPELLLRKLRPISKNSRLKFNYIEQNPIFFNHVLANICNISSETFSKHETYIPTSKSLIPSPKPTKMMPPITMNGAAGDFCEIREDKKHQKAPPESNQKSCQTIAEKKKPKQIRTPMPEKKFVSAKNCLLKTLLLGSLHLTIAFIILTAILYPDVTCF